MQIQTRFTPKAMTLLTALIGVFSAVAHGCDTPGHAADAPVFLSLSEVEERLETLLAPASFRIIQTREGTQEHMQVVALDETPNRGAQQTSCLDCPPVCDAACDGVSLLCESHCTSCVMVCEQPTDASPVRETVTPQRVDQERWDAHEPPRTKYWKAYIF